MKKMAFGLLATTVLFSACKKSNDGESNDEELITTVQLTFTPAGGGASLNFFYRDADGPGGEAPTRDEIKLAASTTYNVSIQLMNESATPVENITPEIVEEAEAHRFYYTASAANLTISNLNNDANGAPVGLTSTWTTTTAAAGTVGVVLRHYGGTPPDKQTADPVNSPKSSTDVDVTFSYSVL